MVFRAGFTVPHMVESSGPNKMYGQVILRTYQYCSSYTIECDCRCSRHHDLEQCLHWWMYGWIMFKHNQHAILTYYSRVALAFNLSLFLTCEYIVDVKCPICQYHWYSHEVLCLWYPATKYWECKTLHTSICKSKCKFFSVCSLLKTTWTTVCKYSLHCLP